MIDLKEYFPDLTPDQLEKYAAMEPLYREWNEKINVISRKDIDNFYLHHVVHSLAVSRVVKFPAGSSVLDLGCGGGFPGIPLAVMFPECRFTLCDSVGKKIKVASAVAESLGLGNVECINCRAEQLKGPFDYVVSRAVADLSDFYPWVKGKFNCAAICLKGGDLDAESAACARKWHIDPARFWQTDISSWFGDSWFSGKKIVVISR